MTPVFAFLFFAASPVAIYSFVLFDRLVRAEYEHHRKAWLDDGEPVGMIWSPADWQHGGSWLARSRVMIVWLFKTPPWVSESEHRDLLRRYRIYSCVAEAMFLVLIVALYLSR
jgi:hypothetical protein